jgi:hypothetical protein
MTLPPDFRFIPETVQLNGQPFVSFVSDQAMIVFSLGDVGAGFRHRISFAAMAHQAIPPKSGCSNVPFAAKATAFFYTDIVKGTEQTTLSVENKLPCAPPLVEGDDPLKQPSHLIRVDAGGERREITSETVSPK